MWIIDEEEKYNQQRKWYTFSTSSSWYLPWIRVNAEHKADPCVLPTYRIRDYIFAFPSPIPFIS
jgi:hypothetical protein